MYDNNYVNELYNLALGANDVATKTASYKEAAYGVGGQQVQPSTPYQNAAGLYDPDPRNAAYSALSEARSDINASTILDGQVVGTNLLPYGNVLNEGYQTIAAGMNVPMGSPGPGMVSSKMASQEEMLQKQAHYEAVWKSGYFSNPNLLPDEEGVEMIRENALAKTASAVESKVIDMINTGVLAQTRPDFIPIFLGQYKQG